MPSLKKSENCEKNSQTVQAGLPDFTTLLKGACIISFACQNNIVAVTCKKTWIHQSKIKIFWFSSQYFRKGHVAETWEVKTSCLQASQASR